MIPTAYWPVVYCTFAIKFSIICEISRRSGARPSLPWVVFSLSTDYLKQNSRVTRDKNRCCKALAGVDGCAKHIWLKAGQGSGGKGRGRGRGRGRGWGSRWDGRPAQWHLSVGKATYNPHLLFLEALFSLVNAHLWKGYTTETHGFNVWHYYQSVS